MYNNFAHKSWHVRGQFGSMITKLIKNTCYIPDGLWFLVPYKDKKIVQHGHWKEKGEACEIFSNCVITGWRTTLEFYEGQDPHERKTNWVMQEFRITQKKWCESKKAEVFC